MLGSFAVGKTSLVQRYVRSIFSDKYLTTVGVKIDKKVLSTDGHDISLVIWDIEGGEELQRTHPSYLRGASGHIFVADGTRPATLDIALGMASDADDLHPNTARILLVNKADLAEKWAVTRDSLDALKEGGWTLLRTSAKTGEGVEDAFVRLTRAMLGDL